MDSSSVGVVLLQQSTIDVSGHCKAKLKKKATSKTN